LKTYLHSLPLSLQPKEIEQLQSTLHSKDVSPDALVFAEEAPSNTLINQIWTHVKSHPTSDESPALANVLKDASCIHTTSLQIEEEYKETSNALH
jgi:hypothetical protein